MSNTVIIIKSSGISTNTPNVETLSYGELSINYADGIIYYKTDLDTLGQIKTTEPAGLDTEIQFNDGGVFGSNANLTFNKSNGTLSIDKVIISNIAFTDGSFSTSLLTLPGIDTEIEFNNNGFANTSLNLRFDYANNTFITYNINATGDVSVGNALSVTGNLTAANVNSQSFIQFGDGTRQYTANAGSGGGGDVTSVAGATGAVSNTQLLDGIKTVDGSGSGLDADTLDGLDSLSFANSVYMQASFDQANSANVLAQDAFDQANSANVLAQAAFDDSNTRYSATGGTISGDVYVTGNIVVSATSVIDANTVKIINVAAPTNSTDAANKQYVDEVAEGLRTRPAVEIATTANLDATYDNGTLGVGATLTSNTNGAFPEIDGVTLTSTTPGENGVLVKNQTNAAHNGRYNLTTVGDGSNPWVLTKCGLCDEANEIPGSYTFVKRGTLYAGTGWIQIVNDPETFVVGTDSVNIFQFSGAGTYTAGFGLTLNVTEFSVSTELNDLINYSAGHANGAFDLANGTAVVANTDFTTISVTPGTYGNATSVAQITVSANGRIESISNVAISGGGGGGTPAGANLQIQFNDDGSFGASANLLFDTSNNTIIVDKIESNVSIGVGTSPSGVVGEIRAANNITAFYTSDIRNKTNIQSIDNALEKVMNIGGKTFDWNDEYIKQHGGEDDYFVRKNDFGVIAQDVLKHFPIAVREKSDGTLAVDYVKLCSLAFQAIVELNEKIKKLEDK